MTPATLVQPAIIHSSLPSTRAQLQLCDNLRLVCHGGLCDQFGYYGWTVATDSHVLAQHYAYANGNHEEMDQQRAILSAIYTSLLWIRQTLNSATLQSHTILHVQMTDWAVYKYLTRSFEFTTWYPNQMLLPLMDLILSIKTHINHLTKDPALGIIKLPKKPQARVY